MKKFFKISWIIFSVLLLIAFLISCISAFIPSSAFSYISIFAILFPYFFLATFIAASVSFFIQKKLAFIMICLLVCSFRNIVSSFGFNSNHWQEKKDSSSFRIMTWNVEGFVNMLPQNNPAAAVRIHMLKLIQKEEPDILCVQEFTNVEHENGRVSLRQELDSIGYKFHFFSNDEIKGSLKGWLRMRGVAIFSKTPFTDSGRINIFHYFPGNENLAFADIMYNKKPLRIFTAHLLSFALFPDTAYSGDEGKNIYEQAYDRKRSILYKLREIENVHEIEAKTIRNEINKSPYPVVYCGDMNTTPASYNFRFLKGNLQDAFIKKGSGIGSTFYKILPTLRIDVCFADEKLKVMQCKVEKRKLSDHYPVITDLQWR